MVPQGLSSMGNDGPHGLSEVLYAFGEAANNNGSAFAGLNANTPFYDVGAGHLHHDRAVRAHRRRARDRGAPGLEEDRGGFGRHAARRTAGPSASA